MSPDSLSQEEINELLKTANMGAGAAPVSILNDMEKDALGELGNISMGSAATAISTILGKRVDITTPSIKETKIDDIRKQFTGHKVIVRVDYTESLNGTNAFILEPHVVAVIADIMMGGTGLDVNDELDELKLSAVGEAMNQMIGSSATALTEIVKGSVSITPPQVQEVNFDDESVNFPPVYDGEDSVVEVKFIMKVEDLVEGDMVQLMTPAFAKKLSGFLTDSLMGTDEPAAAETKPARAPKEPEPDESEEFKYKQPEKPVKKVEFQELEEKQQSQIPSNKLDVLLDIPLEISVELGRTTMTLKQVLDLGVGSLVELEKLTGEPVDILVNGKMVAKGEVVVIGENFGVRITQILSKKERLYSLK